jgi:hypothetical protein
MHHLVMVIRIRAEEKIDSKEETPPGDSAHIRRDIFGPELDTAPTSARAPTADQ